MRNRAHLHLRESAETPLLQSANRPLRALLVAICCANAAGAAAAESGAPVDKEASALAAKQVESIATPEELRRGQKLFDGSVRLAKGGPACNACHHVNYRGVGGGGILASDLTHSYSRVGREGLDSMLADAPFAAMQAAYAGKAITAQEIRALTAFLQHADSESAVRHSVDYGSRLLFGGVGGVVVLAGFFTLIGGRRKRGSVNRDIYERQLKSE